MSKILGKRCAGKLDNHKLGTTRFCSDLIVEMVEAVDSKNKVTVILIPTLGLKSFHVGQILSSCLTSRVNMACET